jgi:hypothetical protein
VKRPQLVLFKLDALSSSALQNSLFASRYSVFVWRYQLMVIRGVGGGSGCAPDLNVKQPQRSEDI